MSWFSKLYYWFFFPGAKKALTLSNKLESYNLNKLYKRELKNCKKDILEQIKESHIETNFHISGKVIEKVADSLRRIGYKVVIIQNYLNVRWD